MSIRKVTICLAVILFISATVLAFTSNKRAEKKAEKEYTPTVQTVTMTAVGDCTLATDINADPNGSFKSVAESLNGDYSYFFKNVAPIFSEDDLTIVNFEGTLSNQGTRQDKQFAFRGKPEYVQILTSSSVEAANLANNHSADYGDVSLSDTIKYLNEAGISNFIGTNTAIRDVNGISVGLVGIDALDETEAVSYTHLFSAINGEFCGSEALIRYFDEDDTIVSPMDFIPAMEYNETVHMIDLYVFRHVCEYISGWIEAGKNIKPVSVNISHCTIVRPNFMENLMDIWFDYNIPKDSIVIEVSEDKVKGCLLYTSFIENDHTLVPMREIFEALGADVQWDDETRTVISYDSVSAVSYTHLKSLI